jgi:DNA-binding IclR family transcriptional regulator
LSNRSVEAPSRYASGLTTLQGGVRNPSWLAEELDYSRQYIHQRLQLLVAAEYVENLGHGLYELNELPDEIEDE